MSKFLPSTTLKNKSRNSKKVLIKWLLLFSLLFFIVSSYSQVVINEQTVKQIKADSTTKNEVLLYFGNPTTKTIISNQEYWFYTSSNYLLNICFNPKDTVASYNYTPISNNVMFTGDGELTDRKYFLELVEKVQNDKSLRGTFIYKGETAIISDSKQIVSVVGKLITINWKNMTATYHTKLGYVTRNLFNTYKLGLGKSAKVEKNKYCSYGRCNELRDDFKQPFILQYQQVQSEVKVIE